MTASSVVGFAEPGWLIFINDGALMTQAFDPKSFELSGQPVNLAEKVRYAADWARGMASVSTNGVLLFQTSPARNVQLEWIDRSGKVIAPIGPPGDYSSWSIAPDGKFASLSRADQQNGSTDVWTLDLMRGVMSRLTSDPNGDYQPLWSADGSRIFWVSDRKNGIYDLFQRAADGSGTDEIVFESRNDKYVTNMSRDGRFLIFEAFDTNTNRDIFVLPLFGDRQAYALVNTEFREGGANLSPDGRYVAYVSDESGSPDVYVQTFTPDGKLGGNKQRISTNGGVVPVFSRTGQELFYVANDGTMMNVAIKTAGTVSTFGEPKGLFKNEEARYGYEVTADGQRFLIGRKIGDDASTINVVLNWTAGLKK